MKLSGRNAFGSFKSPVEAGGGSGKVTVLGSINLDYVIETQRRPGPGETVLGDLLTLLPGGKGANQAVAASRLGGSVSMVGSVGRDQDGEFLLRNLEEQRVCTERITLSDTRTGAAFLTVSSDGENSIVVIPGANNSLVPDHTECLRREVGGGDVLVLQLEVPLDTVAQAARIGREAGATVILNAAPAQDVREVVPHTDVVVVNEHECEALLGYPVGNPAEALRAAGVIRERFDVVAVITLGEAGAVVAGAETHLHIPGVEVTVVDTTGAGDTFVGALAVAFAESIPLEDAVKFAVSAAAFTCTGLGAQSSMPYRDQLNSQVKEPRRGSSQRGAYARRTE